ncbi:MAG: AAA family ATPase [Vicinamibacterales bacterium]
MQPPASLRALGDPIYEAFYGLKEQPFAITTDPRFFYLSDSHQRAFSELLNGLRRRESLLLVTGDTGTGKTTLCRAVTEALGDRTFTAMILNPYMAGAEVLRIVLRDFGLVSHEDLRSGAIATADVPQLLDTLEGFLKSLIPLGSHAVIVLDEAQAVDPVVLDQIRLLTALESEGQRLCQVILCGQPVLLNTLKSEPLMALSERITRRVELHPLPAEQVQAYIDHRLSVAGGAHAVSFDPAAVKMIAELSRGLPRRINVLCDRALQEGRIEGVSVIPVDLVKRAARALAGVHVPLPAAPAAIPTSSAPTVHSPAEPSDSDSLGSTEVHKELTFGQEAPAPALHTRRNVLIGVAALAILVAIGYAAYASAVIKTDIQSDGAVPPHPQRVLGADAGPVPMPTEAEMQGVFGAAAMTATPPARPAIAEPAGAASAPATAPAPRPSGQLPQDGNQLH